MGPFSPTQTQVPIHSVIDTIFIHDVTTQARLDILQTPDIYIDMRSTAREVQAWLKAKQFSNR